MAVFITHSSQETKKLAARFSQKLPSQILALIGNLGSGKTTFVRGLARGLGIKKRILSPSFVLIREYKIPPPYKITPPRSPFRPPRRSNLPRRWDLRFLYHVDLYRLSKNQVQGLGLKELFQNPENLVIIEWAEKAKGLLPKKSKVIHFQYLKNNQRKIQL